MKYFELTQKRSLPLNQKIILSTEAIRNFYDGKDGKVYVAFSGGKDSTVLLHLVRTVYSDCPAVFCDTGLEYQEIVEFVKSCKDITWIKPDMRFDQVLKKHGYPVISKQMSYMIRNCQNPTTSNAKSRHFYLTGEKNYGKDGTSDAFRIPDKWLYLIDAPFKISEKCCKVMKKDPFKKYHKETKRYPFIGMKAEDSRSRSALYLKNGCNSFTGTIQSLPLGFWTDKDINDYIKLNNLPYASIYDKGVNHTGCTFCMFGCHLEKEPNRFQVLQTMHPARYEYCMKPISKGGLGLKRILKYLDVPYENKKEEKK